MSAKVEERNILVQSSNDTITIPSGKCSNISYIINKHESFSVGPRIVSESIRTNISECKESVVISIELRVSYSCWSYG